MSVERFQRPTIADELKLRFLSYKSNSYSDVNEVIKVEIWRLDDADPDNVDKRALMTTITNINHDDVGKYSVDLLLSDDIYTIGKYVDVWHVYFEQYQNDNGTPSTVNQCFDVNRTVWMTSPLPLIYDFNFNFRPNKFRQGSKQYIIVQVTPNVPTSKELEEYYKNLAVISPLTISISQKCGECVPQEEDLRLIVDNEIVEIRERNLGYYFLDTTDMDVGLYDVEFKLIVSESTYLSPKSQLQIY